ncbi:MAG: ribonucleotide reductase subunit alpha [Marinobacter sp.]|nr:ribonucleotide reductase subunit alpha [Marinobacter sp.]
MINNYPDLISAAQSQPQPQRLLFVFCRAELPDDASESERRAFEAGEGGALVPVVCVDKLPQEVAEFEQLREESRHTGQDWDMVFVAAMEGRGGIAPSSDEASQPLTMMVETVRLGNTANYLPFNQAGELVFVGQ